MKKQQPNIDLPLQEGEFSVQDAPAVMLDNGKLCIPQHYLTYAHNQSSVEKIVLDIEYDKRYPVFVGTDGEQVYLQVGIVGFDNYISPHKQNTATQKLVYGRKWRVEPELPTSEIIQTAFLALKKAREHEVRELFRFRHQHKTTPFSTHHDLPLISQNGELVRNQNEHTKNTHEDTIKRIENNLDTLSYDWAKFSLEDVQFISSKNWLVKLNIVPCEQTKQPELKINTFCFILNTLSVNEFNHQLMEELIRLSDHHVEEHFTYKGFARFSRELSVSAISELSLKLRKRSQQETDHFLENIDTTNYQVDKTRVPTLNNSALSDKIRMNLASFGSLDGILPST